MNKAPYSKLADIMPPSWMISYDELKGLLPLSWSFLRFGIAHGFIKANVAVCFCLDEVSRKGISDEQDVSLLSATDDDSILSSIYDRIPDADPNDANVQSQWMHVLLWQVCSRGQDANEILDWVELIYAEFGYPKGIAPFVRYMPATGRANTSEVLARALKEYLDEWRTLAWSQGHQGCQGLLEKK